jgi:hypothetical protein
VTRAHDGGRLALDQDSKCVPVAGEDGRDDAPSFDVDGLAAIMRGFVAFDRADSGWWDSLRRRIGRMTPEG